MKRQKVKFSYELALEWVERLYSARPLVHSLKYSLCKNPLLLLYVNLKKEVNKRTNKNILLTPRLSKTFGLFTIFKINKSKQYNY